MGNDFKTFPEFLKGGGETGALIHSGDWKKILPENFTEWPSNLCFTLSLLLHSKSPMFLFWGPDFTLFYNDAYIPALAANNLHPWALGKKGEDVWSQNWSFIKPELDLVLSENKSGSFDSMNNMQERFSEDIHLTYNLNPIKDNDGYISGILVICNETISVAAREQLQTQRRLEHLNKEITHLFDSVNEGFYSRDTIKNQYIKLSAGCPKIYGYTIEEFFANPMLWAEVIHPEDKERVFADDITLKAGQQTLTEYRIFHKNGEIRWIEVKAIPVISDGILVRVDGIVNDITARKKAELEIRKQKELSESIINSLPGIFYFYDKGGRFIKWNKNFELVSGYSGDEIGTMDPLEFFPFEEKGLLKDEINRVFATGESAIEASFLTKTGEKLPYYFTGRTIYYEGKVCLLGTGIDISKRVEIQETLQKNEGMLSYILNTIPQAIFWKDRNSNYLGCNKVFAKDAGINDLKNIVGKSDFDLPWAPEESEKYRNDDRDVMDSKTPKLHLIETQRQANKQTVWLDTTKIPLTDSNGDVYGILGIYEDITDRKRADEERERMTQDLIEKNVNLKQFSYIVSHNLRSPINKILGLSSLIKMPPYDDDQNYRMVQYIVNETQNLDNVVKDLTTIISFQDLGVSVKEDIVISEEVAVVKKTLEMEIAEAQAEVNCDFEAINSFKTVKGYFYSIIYNLITNAIKYRNPQKPLRIEIESSIENGFVCLSIRDNGQGIDLEKHGSELFGLYHRFHSKDIPGKGLGLNLVKTQAETLGGKVEVESTVGLGSTFKVYFTKD